MYAGSPKHPIFSGSTFGLLSGEKPLYQPQVEGGHEALGGALQQMGLRYEETSGRYNEPERSYIVHNPSLDQMKQLGKMFGQESVVHSQNGQHKLHFTNGEHEGKFHAADHQSPIEHFERPPPDFYTAVPGHGYTRINFNWNQLHEDHGQPQKLAASEKEFTPDEAARYMLVETAKLKKALAPQVPYETQVAMDGLQEQGFGLGDVPQSAGVYGVSSDRARQANHGQTGNFTTEAMAPGVESHYQNLVNHAGMNHDNVPNLGAVAERQFWHGVGSAGISRDPHDPNFADSAHYANHPGQLAADKLGVDLEREAGLYPNAPPAAPLTSTLGNTASADTMKAAWKMSPAHPHAYDWHDGHSIHHEQDVAGAQLPGLAKADPTHATNEQAAGVGVATYKQFALPYGQVNQGSGSNLLHYPYQGKLPEIEKLVHDHGFKTYYAGGKYGKPDLANKNYNTGHLMVYDPTPSSGANFGEEEYTKGWRQIHELAHALTYPELNKVYGEGRRIGKLGTHRTMHESLRSVHWEWLAAHKQRELSKQIGINLPDNDFHKELNTVMHDAAHRAVTGKFTEPSGEGFTPHARKVPLHTALQLVRDSGHQMGLTGLHETLKKAPMAKSELKKARPPHSRDLVTADGLQEQGFKPTPGYASKTGLGTRLNNVGFNDKQGKPVDAEGSLPVRQNGESQGNYADRLGWDGAPQTGAAVRDAIDSDMAPQWAAANAQAAEDQAATPRGQPVVYRPFNRPSEPGDVWATKWSGTQDDGRNDEHFWQSTGVERPDEGFQSGIPAPNKEHWAKRSPVMKRRYALTGNEALPASYGTTAKSELTKSLQSPAAAGVTRAPAPLHTTVEGFMGGLKALPKGDPSRGKFITSHMNHGPFLSALGAHPQGKQIHAMLTTHLNSKANAGPSNAVATVKSELAKGWPKDNAENESNANAFLGQPAAMDHALESTTLKQPTVHDSKTNPAAKLPNIGDGHAVMPYFMGSKKQALGHVDGKIPPNTERGLAALRRRASSYKYGIQGHLAPHEVEEAVAPDGARDPADYSAEYDYNPASEMTASPDNRDATNEYWRQTRHELKTQKTEPIFTKNEGDHTVADEKMYSRDEAVQILLKATKERVEGFERGIRNLRDRELKKALITPHKHNQGMQAGSAAEDVPPGKMNPKGIDKSVAKSALAGPGGEPAVTVKSEGDADRSDKPQTHANHTCTNCGKQNTSVTEAPQGKNPTAWHCSTCLSKSSLNKEELCKKCGKGHGLEKCGDIEAVKKFDLVAENGKRTDNHTVKGSKLPDDAKSKVVPAPGSGGKIKLPGSSLKKNIVGGPTIMGNMLSPGGSLAKAAAPPMAKPPSGKNMGTAVPVSAPKPPKMSAPAAPTMKNDDLEKGIISPGVKQQMSVHMLADASKQAKPQAAVAPIKLPSPAEHATRAAGFAAAMPGPTFQPQPKPSLASPKAAGVTRSTSPVMNAAKPQASKPGIFGKLFGKSEGEPHPVPKGWNDAVKETIKEGPKLADPKVTNIANAPKWKVKK